MARVTLYHIPELQKNKNVTINFANRTALNNYFSAIPKYVFPEDYIGWVKNENSYEQTITIPRNLYKNYNYVKIIHEATISTTKPEYYYYVVDVIEFGNDQYELKLELDTIMTYIVALPIVNIESNKSLIFRKHKNRFVFDQNPKVLIDSFIEDDNNINHELKRIFIQNPNRARFVYRNRAKDWKPVAYVFAETANVSITHVASDWTQVIIPESGANKWLYVWDGNYQYALGDGPYNYVTDDWNTYFHLYGEFNGIKQIVAMKKSDGTTYQVKYTIPPSSDLKLNIGPITVNKLYYVHYVDPNYTSWSDIQSQYDYINNAGNGTTILPTFSDINPFDSKIQKIVEIPYLDKTMIFKKDEFGVYVDLTQNNEKNFSNIPIYIKPIIGSYDTSKIDKPRVVGNDPKLSHSQFAPMIFTINGVAVGFLKEQMEKTNGLLNGTNLIQDSKLLINVGSPSNFNLTIKPNDNYIFKKEDELRASWTVNNEVFSVKDEAYTYNEYYRDIDEKQRRISEQAAQRNLILGGINQALGIGGGLVAAGANINPAVLAARAGGAAISVAQSIMDHQDNMKQNELEYRKKYLNLIMSASIMAGGDLSFIKSYNGDSLRILHYGLSENSFNYWDEYFHKYGYRTLEFTNINLRTRKYFNYIEAEIDEKNLTPILNEKSKEDIRRRFREGITFFHCTVSQQPDWNQEKENWEL